jgi:hypothetical protein
MSLHVTMFVNDVTETIFTGRDFQLLFHKYLIYLLHEQNPSSEAN